MMKLFSLGLLIVLFVGCASEVVAPRPKIVSDDKSIEHKYRVKGVILDGAKGIFTSLETWKKIKLDNMFNILKANSLIDIIENYNKHSK